LRTITRIAEPIQPAARRWVPDAVKRRMTVVDDLPELELTDQAETLAAKLLLGAALPQKAKADALHIAVATVHGIDYLLTWNCKHIANAIMRPKIESICRAAGLRTTRDLYTA